MRRFFKLLKIEGCLVLRSLDSIFFGVCMPVGIIALLGIICGSKPAFVGANYTLLESSFGALITVGICATAFMGIPLTIADYRDKKILKHFFVTPVSPAVLILVQGAINVILSLVSAVLVYLTVKLFFGYEMRGSKIGFTLSYFLVIASMYSIGMLMASVCKNIKTANVVCSIVYFPMLFLSGATIPYEVFPKALQQVANLLPLTQGIKLLKGYSLGLPQENLLLPIVIMLVWSAVGISISIKTFIWE
ncbi:ABC transporter permease [Clostridium sp. CF012]|uniref:ABC transporter permease n=1 Tax=Clostridium sp. CF012 TaxID=2843319 RepID=UPI001C0DA0E5|nr:ABC transporter permease [Clostridium sp. CF012]MBU3146687.1 ABC transporter permease [Clostridium sp. CF012]